MVNSVDFYFDYLSPYAYLAWLSLPKVCADRGVTIVPKPVLFAGLLNYWGQLGPAEIPPKGRHVFKECARFAALADIPFRSPKFHPFRPLMALRVSLAAAGHERQGDIITALFQAGWGRGEDLGDAATIVGALEALGLRGEEWLTAAETAQVKAQLRSETDAATGLGVFGVPTVLVGDELFWGLDQLKYIELFLDGRDPLAGVNIADQMGQGRAVDRPQWAGRGPK